MDYCDAVKLLANADSEKIKDQIFNVGYQNMSINQIAEVVKNTVEAEFPEIESVPIIKTESNDNRSYHINSDKINNILGFKASRTIEDAIKELCDKFRNNQLNISLENDIYYNIQRMKNLKVS